MIMVHLKQTCLTLSLLLLAGVAGAAEPTVEDLRKAHLALEIAETQAKAADVLARTQQLTPGQGGNAIEPVRRLNQPLSLDGRPGAGSAPSTPTPQATPPAIEPPSIVKLSGVEGGFATVSLRYDGLLYEDVREGRYVRDYQIARIHLDTLCVDLQKAARNQHRKRKGKPWQAIVHGPVTAICVNGATAANLDNSPAHAVAPQGGA